MVCKKDLFVDFTPPGNVIFETLTLYVPVILALANVFFKLILLILIVLANSIDICNISFSGPKPTGPSTSEIQEEIRKK